MKHSIRFQLLTTAVPFALVSSITSMTAYLTDFTEPYNAVFQMKYGENFGINIKADSYLENEIVTPDKSAGFDPYLINEGNYDAYVFMEINLPDHSFVLNDISDNWTLLSDDADRIIYAYGSKDSLTTVSAAEKNTDGSFLFHQSPSLCTSVSIDPDTMLEQGSYTVQATGYAIQTEGLQTDEPAKVWNMIGA